jgi:hypothetical protein
VTAEHQTTLTPEQIAREIRRRNLRPWARSRCVIAAAALPALAIHATVGLLQGLSDGVSELREAWRSAR